MKIFKRLFGLVLYLGAFILLLFAVCELWFRIKPPSYTINFPEKMAVRVWEAWLNPKNNNPLDPPFKIFANKDFKDKDRLEKISQETRLPPNTTLVSFDFLRDKKKRMLTGYSAYINQYGYRDPPRAKEKPEKTFRIFALGAYHTFGHAVADEETFPRILETLLNQQSGQDIHFEVWNGGRHAASAIVGLAQLKNSVMSFAPDLIILDYGFVDIAVIGDDTFPVAGLFSSTGKFGLLPAVIHSTKSFLAGRSILFTKGVYFLVKSYALENTRNFIMVFNEMLAYTREKNIPVIVLRQVPTSIPSEIYKMIVRPYPNAVLLEALEAFIKFPPSPAVTQSFYAQENWLSEDFTVHGKPPVTPPYPVPEYFTDVFQYNKFGNAAIAAYLAETIRQIPKRNASSVTPGSPNSFSKNQ